MKKIPDLGFWKLWNISFGFFGVQIAYALQSANISRIFSTLGADPHSLSYFVTRNFAASLFRNIKYFTLRKLYLCRKWMQKRLQKTTTTGITLPNFDFLA